MSKVIAFCCLGMLGCMAKCTIDEHKKIQRENDIEKRIEYFMSDQPHNEVNNIKKFYYKGEHMQSALDSMAYREIFMGTHAAKDSVIVEEFNKVASSMRKPSPQAVSISDRINANLSKVTTWKQYNKIQKEVTGFIEKDVLALQFKADSVAYRRFFEKHGLMSKAIERKLTLAAKKIKP